MRFNQYTWNLYKNSPEGEATISSFSDRKEWIEKEQILEKYNPRLKDSFNKIPSVIYWSVFGVIKYQNMKI